MKPLIDLIEDPDTRVSVQKVTGTGESVVCLTIADRVLVEFSALQAVRVAVALRDAAIEVAEGLMADPKFTAAVRAKARWSQ